MITPWFRLPLASLLAVLFLSLNGCGLMVSEEREVDRMMNNFIARLNKSEWDRAAALTSDDVVYITAEGRTKSKGAAAYYTKLLKEMPGRDIVAFEKLTTSKINDTTYVAKIKMQVRIADPTRSVNYFWEASFKWVKSSGVWKITEMKDLTTRNRSTGY